MVENWLALHVTSNCQLQCKHCYCRNYISTTNDEIPLEFIKNLCEDFLSTEFPLREYSIILSGGESLLYSKFEQLYDLIRKFQDHVILSTNGIHIPKYIDVFDKNDGIQVSIDGDRETHDRIRGKGSYDKAIKALECLKEHGINHSIGFMLCRWNYHCIDHIIDLCKRYKCTMLNFGLYQPFTKSRHAVRYTEWLKAKEYASKHVKTLVTCVETGCVAGICGIAVTPDLNYWDCPRHQEIIGRYPQPIQTVIKKPEDMANPFGTCCKYLGW
ncbi:MAG: Coenzyme PQQ synthesis protein E [Candidatus Methanophagaceae archaeon]|nr:MAG: Coenzyme PQQ synthesis protein E [Methanophagales archaeon]KAF5431771.1 Radical SAM superfamily enzyme [Methanophagales archaeon]